MKFRVEKNENLILTPFEKNLEVWRQLWRVVERSDVVVQIIDSRNPLLFRSKVIIINFYDFLLSR